MRNAGQQVLRGQGSVGVRDRRRQRRVLQVRVFPLWLLGKVELAVSGRGTFQPGVRQGKNRLPGI